MNRMYYGMISMYIFFHCICVLRIYESNANMSILIAKCSSDFFLYRKRGQFPNQNIILSHQLCSFQQSRFSWGKSRNENWQLSKWGVTKLGTGMMKHSWEERKDSKGFGFMKCQTLCYAYVVSVSLVFFVLPLNF